MARTDAELAKLLAQPAFPNAARPGAREAKLAPLYQQVAIEFADLHDRAGRLKAKGVIRDVVSWEGARGSLQAGRRGPAAVDALAKGISSAGRVARGRAAPSSRRSATVIGRTTMLFSHTGYARARPRPWSTRPRRRPTSSGRRACSREARADAGALVAAAMARCGRPSPSLSREDRAIVGSRFASTLLVVAPRTVAAVNTQTSAFSSSSELWSYPRNILRWSRSASCEVIEVSAADDRRCPRKDDLGLWTDVVPLTPITNRLRELGGVQNRRCQREPVVKSGVLANQTLYLGGSMPSKYSQPTPGKASSMARGQRPGFTGPSRRLGLFLIRRAAQSLRFLEHAALNRST